MACNCAERREAMARAAVAIAEGRTDDAKAEVRRITQSAADDAARLQAWAKERASAAARLVRRA